MKIKIMYKKINEFQEEINEFQKDRSKLLNETISSVFTILRILIATFITKRLRRVARFDIELVKKAVSLNKPTEIVIMGVDYLDYRNKSVKDFKDLALKAKSFIYFLEEELNTKINIIGVGPMDVEIINRKIMKVIRYR